MMPVSDMDTNQGRKKILQIFNLQEPSPRFFPAL